MNDASKLVVEGTTFLYFILFIHNIFFIQNCQTFVEVRGRSCSSLFKGAFFSYRYQLGHPTKDHIQFLSKVVKSHVYVFDIVCLSQLYTPISSLVFSKVTLREKSYVNAMGSTLFVYVLQMLNNFFPLGILHIARLGRQILTIDLLNKTKQRCMPLITIHLWEKNFQILMSLASKLQISLRDSCKYIYNNQIKNISIYSKNFKKL